MRTPLMHTGLRKARCASSICRITVQRNSWHVCAADLHACVMPAGILRCRQTSAPTAIGYRGTAVVLASIPVNLLAANAICCRCQTLAKWHRALTDRGRSYRTKVIKLRSEFTQDRPRDGNDDRRRQAMQSERCTHPMILRK